MYPRFYLLLPVISLQLLTEVLLNPPFSALSVSQLTISVALCTYNGERYLPEQLASIADQTLLPNEVVIVDDGSSDGSVALVSRWARSVPFLVHIHQNISNLGSTKSFEKAMSLCTSDILVLSDQDDAWRTDRLAQTVSWFVAKPEMDAVFCNADLIDEYSKPTGQYIWDMVQFGPEKQQKWQQGLGYELLFSGYIVTGATMAIRRAVLPILMPFPTHVQYLIHDAWISLVLALKGTIGFIDEPLIRYRQHSSQQVGFKASRAKVTLKDRLRRSRAERMAPILQTATRYQQLDELLRQRPDIAPQRLTRLHRMTDHLDRRIQLPPARLLRIPLIMSELIKKNYQLFPGQWWKTTLGDLVEN